MPQAVLIMGMAQLVYADNTVVYYITEDFFMVYTFQKNRATKCIETKCRWYFKVP